MDTSDKINIKFKYMDEILEMEVDLNCKLSTYSEKISEKWNNSVENLVIYIYSGRILDVDKTLRELDIRQDSVIIIFFRNRNVENSGIEINSPSSHQGVRLESNLSGFPSSGMLSEYRENLDGIAQPQNLLFPVGMHLQIFSTNGASQIQQGSVPEQIRQILSRMIGQNVLPNQSDSVPVPLEQLTSNSLDLIPSLLGTLPNIVRIPIIPQTEQINAIDIQETQSEKDIRQLMNYGFPKYIVSKLYGINGNDIDKTFRVLLRIMFSRNEQY